MEMQALSLDKIKLKINKVQEFMLSDFKPPTHTHIQLKEIKHKLYLIKIKTFCVSGYIIKEKN